jgi:hypothetical protein
MYEATECAIVKFFNKQGVPELAYYCNFIVIFKVMQLAWECSNYHVLVQVIKLVLNVWSRVEKRKFQVTPRNYFKTKKEHERERLY